MLTKEYRIPVPVSLDEYRLAQIYSIAMSARSETKDGEGIEILVNEPFEDENGHGHYTHKIYRFSQYVRSVK